MDKLSSMMNLPENTAEQSFDFSSPEYLSNQCAVYNRSVGYLNDLDGYDCPVCKNKGRLEVIVNGEIVMRLCEKCTPIRRSLKNLKESGLDDLDFNSFEVKDEWQKRLKETVLNFVHNTKGEWLFLGGQSGCGKTHLCSAAVRYLVYKYSIKGVVFKWQEDAKRLKQLINDSTYTQTIDSFKNVKVLYIDDFFKCKRGEKPTPADINLAFELIDYRYTHKLLTIISSELSLDEIIGFDEALGGRICEKAKAFTAYIKRDREKNYRLK